LSGMWHYSSKWKGGTMRRLLRWAFNFAAVLLFVAMGVLWVRSYVVEDRFYYSTCRMLRAPESSRWDEFTMWVTTGRGVICFEYRRSSIPQILPGDESVAWDRFSPPQYAGYHFDSFWGRLDFGYWQRGIISPATSVWAPMWPLVLFCAISPMIWVLRLFRSRASFGAGLCALCGYDVRATPDRCPECGASPKAKGAT
jgi:hypothetical protein